jgi:polar amino acid transport system substrate-binding protein
MISAVRRSLPALFLVSAWLISSLPAHADIVTLRSDYWCPYSCDPNSDHPGYLVEIAKEVFGKAGLTVDYQLMPWKRVITLVKEGTVDGAVGATIHEIPHSFMPEGGPLGVNRAALVMLEDTHFDFKGIESLQTLKIGVVSGYLFDDEGPIDDYVQEHRGKEDGRIVESFGVEGDMTNLKKLVQGHVDAVMDDQQVLAYSLSRMTPRPKVRIVPIGQQIDISLAFSPRNSRSIYYTKLLSEGIAEMRRNGRLLQILGRYGLAD